MSGFPFKSRSNSKKGSSSSTTKKHSSSEADDKNPSRRSSKISVNNMPANKLNFNSPDDLDMIRTIGTGTFGRVILCKSKVDLRSILSARMTDSNDNSSKNKNASSSKSSSKQRLSSNSSVNSNTPNDNSSNSKNGKIFPHASQATDEGYFALKMLNIRQVIKLKQLQHVKNEKIACWNVIIHL